MRFSNQLVNTLSAELQAATTLPQVDKIYDRALDLVTGHEGRQVTELLNRCDARWLELNGPEGEPVTEMNYQPLNR